MGRNYQKIRWRKAGQIIGKTRQSLREGEITVIIVEGQRDKKRLISFGFEPEDIEILNQGKSLLARADEVILRNSDHFRIEILMDWDRTGNQLQRKLVSAFRTHDINYSTLLRDQLIIFLTPETRCVEGIGIWQELLDGINDSDPC